MERKGESNDGKKIQNDNMGDESFRNFLEDAFGAADLNMRPGAAFYIWHADFEGFNFSSSARSTGWIIRQIPIWVKNALVLGRKDYQTQHEPCLYGWKSSAGHYFRDIRTETTVFDDERPIEELVKCR